MSTSTTTAATGFQPARLPSTADELLGRLLLVRPLTVRDFDTKHGQSTATIAQVVAIDAAGEIHQLGERALFWQLVRRQLEDATADLPWIADRLVQAGQAYRLDPPSREDERVLGSALEQLNNSE